MSSFLEYLIDQALVEISKTYSICLNMMRKTRSHLFTHSCIFFDNHLLGCYHVPLAILEAGNEYFLKEHMVQWGRHTLKQLITRQCNKAQAQVFLRSSLPSALRSCE